ncbi:MAG: deoxyribodipyrimidine photolyase [Polyangiaceae bacterium]
MNARLRPIHDVPPHEAGGYVLYWMTANRRPSHNHGLDRAVDWCRRLGKPLVVLEALRCDYPWASDRFHRFVIDGMEDNRRAFDRPGVTYHPYVEPSRGAGKGLLAALAKGAAVVVTDDFPAFFLPRMLERAGEQLAELGRRLEAVDGNGLYPMRASEGRIFTRAVDFRRHLQKTLAPHLTELAQAEPLDDLAHLSRASLPAGVAKRWPAAKGLERGSKLLAGLPIDHTVAATDERGGHEAAQIRLRAWLDDGFPRYADGRNHPDDDASSGLSPYLHFGHVSPQEILLALAEREGWTPADLSGSARGQKEGWWGMSAAAESFLDELVTWRELGYNFCAHRDDYDQLSSLPGWALQTIAEHADDERPVTYTLDQLRAAETHDPIWNAAQRQLRDSGRMHNYLRMLWGKLIYQWSPDAADALAAMIELNNRYALDGRNPNSYSGIFWVLGRYDRAWGPERPIFGKLRYMTSDSTRKKLHLGGYLERWGR